MNRKKKKDVPIHYRHYIYLSRVCDYLEMHSIVSSFDILKLQLDMTDTTDLYPNRIT